MLRYKLKTKRGEVQVSLDSEQPQKVAPIQYEGDSGAVLDAKRWLYFARGTYGQLLTDWTAPVDLKAVMASEAARAFSPVLVEERMGMRARSVDAEGGG